MANANSNGNEEAAVAIAGAPQKITESFERLEADRRRIDTEFKEEPLRYLSALLTEGDTEELALIAGGRPDDAT